MLVKTCFILNPHSGRGSRETRLSQTRRYFQKKLGQFSLVITKDRADVTEQTRHALQDGFDQIVVLGGDGTVNAAINGFFEGEKLIRAESCLVVSKWGTGSDYYKTIVAGSYVSDWKTLVTEFNPRAVDLGEIEFAGQKKYFINLASAGLSAQVAEMKNKNPRWVPGSLSYLVPAVRALMKYRVTPVRLSYDSRTRDSAMMAVFVAKGIYAGGGMRFGGAVEPDDGYFDVKVFEEMGLVKSLRRIPRLYQGRFEGLKEIHTFRARELRIESPVPLPVECDGEVYGHTDVTIRVRPKALRVCWPRD